MILLKKIKMEKITSKNPKLASTLTKLLYFSEEATMFLLWDTAASPTCISYLQYRLTLSLD